MAKQVDSPTSDARIMPPEALAKLDKRITSNEKEIAAQRQDIGDAIAQAEVKHNANRWALKVWRQLAKRPEVAFDRWAHLVAYVEGSGILEPAQADIETTEERKGRARKAANVTEFPAA